MRPKSWLGGTVLLLLMATGYTPGALPFNPGALFSDAATSHWPAAHFIRRSLSEGEFPLWRETTFAGAPFAANPLNKTAYPLQWLAAFVDAESHLSIMIFIHVSLAAAGMGYWMRQIGLLPVAAAVAAALYAFSPRLLAHTGAGHVDLVYALAWWPWVMLAVRRSMLEPGLHAVLMTALFAALMVLADIRLSLFALFAAAVYGLDVLLRSRPERGLVMRAFAASVASIVGLILLTASVTMPLLGWSPYLTRAALTPQEAGIFSFEPLMFVGLILPQHGGAVELLAYSGVSALLLALVGLRAMPRKLWVFAVLIGFGALYALGPNGFLWPSLVSLAPPLLWFRVPARAWFLAVLSISVLAGWGAETLAKARWGNRRLAFAGLIACVTGGVLMIVGLPLPASAGLALIAGGGGVCLAILLARDRGLERWGGCILLLALTIELTLAGRAWLEWRPPADWLERDAAIAQLLLAEDADRVYSPAYSLTQTGAEAFHLRLFGGVDPFQIAGVVDAVHQAGGIESSGYSVIVPALDIVNEADLAVANRDAVPDPNLLAEWAVSHVVVPYPVPLPSFLLVADVGGILVYRNLAYRPDVLPSAVPRWPAATGLPSAQTIQALNEGTLYAAAWGWAMLLLTASALIMVQARRRG
ncbi:MAG: hypothetical protein SNJ59_09565 [Aggregatilineales bacterium]